MSDSRSLRVRLLSVLFGFALIAVGCGGDAEDAGPAVTVSRTSTPVTTASTTTESTTTTTTEPTTTEEEEEVEEEEEEEVEESTTTTTEIPTTLAFADDDNSTSGNSGGASSGNGDTATATTVAGGVDTTVAGDGATAETTTTIATTTTIDPFAPLVDFDQIVLPYSDPGTSVAVQSVNLKCDSNGVSPQLLIFAPFDLSGADQRVTFYGPSGASYIVTGQVGSGNVETFTNWLTDPVVADSFDWVSICSQPSWKVLIELSDAAGGLFSAVADTSISG